MILSFIKLSKLHDSGDETRFNSERKRFWSYVQLMAALTLTWYYTIPIDGIYNFSKGYDGEEKVKEFQILANKTLLQT